MRETLRNRRNKENETREIFIINNKKLRTKLAKFDELKAIYQQMITNL